MCFHQKALVSQLYEPSVLFLLLLLSLLLLLLLLMLLLFLPFLPLFFLSFLNVVFVCVLANVLFMLSAVVAVVVIVLAAAVWYPAVAKSRTTVEHAGTERASLRTSPSTTILVPKIIAAPSCRWESKPANSPLPGIRKLTL